MSPSTSASAKLKGCLKGEMRNLAILVLPLLAVLSGCRTESPEGACTLENFIAGALAEDAPREIPAWDRSSKYEIICRNADKVSYRATEYQYTGGAHGYTLVSVGTVDRKTGRKYELADIVPASRRGELLRKVREDIAIRRYGAKTYAEWRARQEITFFDEPRLTENFYFDDQAIHFVYNQYEIACYADGIIEAIVPR